MGYSDERFLRISKLIDEIQGRREHEYAASTYKDRPALMEIEELINTQISLNEDKETLSDSIVLLRFLADRYESMGRFVISAGFYNKIFVIAALLKQKYGKNVENIDDVFYTALRVRNFYVDDDCEDISALAKRLIPEDKVELILEERKQKRRTLKHDPIEMSEKYLDVIDKVEEKIENARQTHGHGSCHEIWQLQRKYLAEYGIEWHSPAHLNPRVHFD